MFSGVLQDSTMELLDAGRLSFASAMSVTLSQPAYRRFMSNPAAKGGDISSCATTLVRATLHGGGHTPHLLGEALSWHARYRDERTMRGVAGAMA